MVEVPAAPKNTAPDEDNEAIGQFIEIYGI